MKRHIVARYMKRYIQTVFASSLDCCSHMQSQYLPSPVLCPLCRVPRPPSPVHYTSQTRQGNPKPKTKQTPIRVR